MVRSRNSCSKTKRSFSSITLLVFHGMHLFYTQLPKVPAVSGMLPVYSVRDVPGPYHAVSSGEVFRSRKIMVPSPHTPGVFFAKSAESPENKRVEFCASAKKRKRVPKNVKRQGIDRKHAGRFAGLKVRTSKRPWAPGGSWMCGKHWV